MPANSDYLPFIQVWKKIFSDLNLPSFQSAMELCCGVFPKVGLAIDGLALADKIYYVDASQYAINQCKRVVEEQSRNPAIFVQSTLNQLNICVNMITGNHILDDLLLNFYLKAIESNANPYANKDTFFKITDAAVAYFEKNNHQKDAVSCLAKQIDRCLSPDGYFLLSDYISYYEKEYEMKHWPQLRFSLQQELSKEFCALGYHIISYPRVPKLLYSINIWKKPSYAK